MIQMYRYGAAMAFIEYMHGVDSPLHTRLWIDVHNEVEPPRLKVIARGKPKMACRYNILLSNSPASSSWM